jgi:hypothetical protein
MDYRTPPPAALTKSLFSRRRDPDGAERRRAAGALYDTIPVAACKKAGAAKMVGAEHPPYMNGS